MAEEFTKRDGEMSQAVRTVRTDGRSRTLPHLWKVIVNCSDYVLNGLIQLSCKAATELGVFPTHDVRLLCTR